MTPTRDDSSPKAVQDEASICLVPLGHSSSTVSQQSETNGEQSHGACDAAEPLDQGQQGELVICGSSLVPIIEVETFNPSHPPSSAVLEDGSHGEEEEEEKAPAPVLKKSMTISGVSPASYFESRGPYVIRCFQVVTLHTPGVGLLLCLISLCHSVAAKLKELSLL